MTLIFAALLLAALIRSVYRAVVTKGYLRINATVLSAATVMGVAGLVYNTPFLIMVAAPACLLFGIAQIMTDPGWSKLAPLVQFALGFVLFNVLLFSGP